MEIRTQTHRKFVTNGENGAVNGFLVPIFNVNDGFFLSGKEPQQVYLTTILPGTVKGPHLHFVRTGFFTCIKGNVRIVLKTDQGYREFLSGEDHEFLSIEVPTGVPAAIQCIGSEEAYLLNMPNPAWTPDMDDEHSADFSDFDFSKL